MVVHYLVKPANWCKFLASWGWYAVTSYCSSGECWGHLSALRYGSVYPSHSTWKLKWLEKDSPFRIRFHVNLGECTIFGPWIVIHKVILPSQLVKVFGESWSSTLGDLDGILHGSGAWSLWCQVDDGEMRRGGFLWRPATSTSHGGLEVGVGGVELRYYDLLEASKGNRLARLVSWQWEPDKIRRMFVWLILLSKPWRQSSVLGLNSVLTHTLMWNEVFCDILSHDSHGNQHGFSKSNAREMTLRLKSNMDGQSMHQINLLLNVEILSSIYCHGRCRLLERLKVTI